MTLDDVTIELKEVNDNLVHISKNTNETNEYLLLTIDTFTEKFTALLDFFAGNSLKEIEEEREEKEYQKDLLNAISGGGGNAGGGGGNAGGGGKGLGILGALGGMKMAGIGIGAGALAGGLGILAGGGAFLLKTLEDLDTEALKENVNNLLSIGESFKGGTLDFLKAGGSFFLVMTGLGLGLIAFSAGQGFAAAVDYFTKDSNFAENIKENVKTLLSISDEVDGLGGALLEGGTFTLLMGGLAAGLAIFGAAGVLTSALDLFTKDGWAQKIKDNVKTLLLISDEVDGLSGALLEGGTFIALMTGLTAGLAIFGAAGVLTSALDLFTKDGWAQKIKDNVKTLLSISDEVSDEDATMLGKSGAFALSMAGIAGGLTVFAVGQLASNLGNTFSSDGWAQGIVDNVVSLLSITDHLSDGDGESSKASKFAAGMAKISAGLLAFTASEAIGSLAGVGETILGFFGSKSPFSKIMEIAKEASELEKGAGAIEKIANALNVFGGIKISDIDVDFAELAENLGKAIPFIDALANGGEVKGSGGWLSKPLVFEKGILDPSLRIDELSKQIQKVNYVLGRGKAPVENISQLDQSVEGRGALKGVEVSAPNQKRVEVLGGEAQSAEIEKQMMQMQSQSAGGGEGGNVTVIDSSNKSTNTINEFKPAPSPVRQPNSPSESLWNMGGSFAP